MTQPDVSVGVVVTVGDGPDAPKIAISHKDAWPIAGQSPSDRIKFLLGKVVADVEHTLAVWDEMAREAEAERIASNLRFAEMIRGARDARS
jgi:hypothetical protein